MTKTTHNTMPEYITIKVHRDTRQRLKMLAVRNDESLVELINRMVNQEEKRTMTTARDFGTVTHEGKTYTLTAQADYSNRLFTDWWGDAKEGETYTVEFNCTAIDEEGYDYAVYWQFDDIKGQEREPDSYPFDDEHVTRVIPQ